MYYTKYDTCTRRHADTQTHTHRLSHTLTLHCHPRSVRPARVRSAAPGGGAGTTTEEQKLLLQAGEEQKLLLRAGRSVCPGSARCRCVARPGAWGPRSAAPESARRHGDGTAAGGALGKRLRQNKSFPRTVLILKLLHHPHEKGPNEEFVKVASSSKLGKSEGKCVTCAFSFFKGSYSAFSFFFLCWVRMTAHT